jgi:hypothetical protein
VITWRSVGRIAYDSIIGLIPYGSIIAMVRPRIKKIVSNDVQMNTEYDESDERLASCDLYLQPHK